MFLEHKYILPPVIGAIIGWLTNWVAIKLLFRPHKPINIMGFELQGLIPKRRREIAQGIAKTIEAELLSSKDIASALEGINWKEEVEKIVSDIIDGRFTHINKIPIIGLVSEDISSRVKYVITKDILSHLDEKKGDLARKFTDSVDVEKMLTEKIDELDLKTFENLLTEFIARELRHIEWLGGVMGFIIGLIQVGIYYLLK